VTKENCGVSAKLVQGFWLPEGEPKPQNYSFKAFTQGVCAGTKSICRTFGIMLYFSAYLFEV